MASAAQSNELETPLALYLREIGITQAVFAVSLGRVRGCPIGQPHVSKWASGARLPSRATQLELELATRGAVTRSDWETYRARRDGEV